MRLPPQPVGKPFARACSVCLTSYWSDTPGGPAICSAACQAIVDQENTAVSALGHDPAGMLEASKIGLLRQSATQAKPATPDQSPSPANFDGLLYRMEQQQRAEAIARMLGGNG